MVIKSEKLHIICGVCGSRNDFKFCNRGYESGATLTCNNCATLTDIQEELED